MSVIKNNGFLLKKLLFFLIYTSRQRAQIETAHNQESPNNHHKKQSSVTQKKTATPLPTIKNNPQHFSYRGRTFLKLSKNKTFISRVRFSAY